MNPWIGKIVIGGVGSAVLGAAALGATAVPALAANTGGTGAASPAAASPAAHGDRHADRRAIAKAVFEAEADVLGLKPEQLRDDIRKGQKVSDLARDRGMTKEQFADRLAAAVKPALDRLVDSKEITRAQADRELDRIHKGHIPFWDGARHPKAKA